MKPSDYISKHITYGEVIRSQTAARLGIKNEPSPKQLINITFLCKYVLDRIRDFYGKPYLASSIYRGTELNKAVGGSDTSQHCCPADTAAADGNIAGIDDKQVFDDIVAGKINVNYDQLIWEYDEWVHISTHADQSKNRHQVWIYTKAGKQRIR